MWKTGKRNNFLKVSSTLLALKYPFAKFTQIYLNLFFSKICFPTNSVCKVSVLL